MRMSGRGSFAIDHELSRWEVMLVGAYRPLIGSVSGIVVYFLVQTPLIPIEQTALTLPFYVVVAFLAGFSERWTRVVLSGAMRTIGEHEPRPSEPAPPPAAVARTSTPLEPETPRATATSAGSPGEPPPRPFARRCSARGSPGATADASAIQVTQAGPHRHKAVPAAVQAFVLSLRSEGWAPRAVAEIRHARRYPQRRVCHLFVRGVRDSRGDDLAKPIPGGSRP